MTYEHFLTSSAMFSFEVAISSTVSTAKKRQRNPRPSADVGTPVRALAEDSKPPIILLLGLVRNVPVRRYVGKHPSAYRAKSSA